MISVVGIIFLIITKLNTIVQIYFNNLISAVVNMYIVTTSNLVASSEDESSRDENDPVDLWPYET